MSILSIKNSSIKKTMLLTLLVISLTASFLLIVFLYHQTREFSINKSEEKIKNMLLMHNAIHDYVTVHQKPEVYKLKNRGNLYQEYFSPEILSSSFMTRNIHTQYNRLRKENGMSDFYYKLAAHNPRNPLNRADTFEEELIQRFNRREISEYRTVIEQDGEKYLYFALPFTENTEACMKCHSTPEAAPKELVERYGNNNGFHEKVGDIRAIISMRVPLKEELISANNVFTKLSIVTFGTILLFFLGGLSFLIILKITGPISRLTKASSAMAAGDLDHSIETDGQDEFSVLARSFVQMRDSIRETIFNLQKEIQDRKYAEHELRESNARLQLSLHASNIGLWDWNPETNKVYFSPEWKKQIGYGENEISNRYEEWETHLHPEDREFVLTDLRNCVDGKQPYYAVEFRFRHKNGSYRWIFARGELMYDTDGNPSNMMGCHIDITEQKNRDEEQEKLEIELQKSHRLESIGILAGGIAHDFNNILSAMMNNVFLARSNLDRDCDAFRNLENVERAIINATNLTQQLLTFSRGGEPIKETASIIDIIRENADFTLRGSNVRCKYYFPENPWPVDVDKGQISQVIQNVIINADQSMPEGGIILCKVENVSISRDTNMPIHAGMYLQISFKDHGAGISKDHIHKIFDPFFSTKKAGRGLGLAVCFSIIKKHEGHILVDSLSGEGTTFTIYLPASEKEVTGKAAPEIIPASGEGRVLIMDDENMLRNSLAEILRAQGYEVESATDGNDAIELYTKAMESSTPFDAVILDLTVPGGMGGREALKKLLSMDPAVKAIVSSGYSTDPVMSDYKKYGFSGMVAKPFKVKELYRIVHEVMNS